MAACTGTHGIHHNIAVYEDGAAGVGHWQGLCGRIFLLLCIYLTKEIISVLLDRLELVLQGEGPTTELKLQELSML